MKYLAGWHCFEACNKMASRWRRWNQNQDFVVDILSDESRLNSLFMKTKAVKGRGKIELDFNQLAIPDLKQEDDFITQEKIRPISSTQNRTKKHCKVVGRGRGRKANIDDIIGLRSNSPLQVLHNAGNRARIDKGKKLEQEWPSLNQCSSNEQSPQMHRKSNKDENSADCVEKLVGAPKADVTNNVATVNKESKDTQTTTANVEQEVNPVKDDAICDDDAGKLTTNLLKMLEMPERWIIIDGLPLSVESKKEIKEMIETFGKMESCQFYKTGKALIRMEEELQCEWIISCMDGSELSTTSSSVSVLRVSDVISDDLPVPVSSE